jgi:hypothetical protein
MIISVYVTDLTWADFFFHKKTFISEISQPCFRKSKVASIPPGVFYVSWFESMLGCLYGYV